MKQCKVLIKSGEKKLEESEAMLQKVDLEMHEAAMQARYAKLDFEKKLKDTEDRCRALDIERNDELSRRVAAEEKVKDFNSMFGNQKERLGNAVSAYEETLGKLEDAKIDLLNCERLFAKGCDALNTYQTLCESVSDAVARMAVAYSEDVSLEYHAKQKEKVDRKNVEAMRVVKSAAHSDQSELLRMRASSDATAESEDRNRQKACK